MPHSHGSDEGNQENWNFVCRPGSEEEWSGEGNKEKMIFSMPHSHVVAKKNKKIELLYTDASRL